MLEAKEKYEDAPHQDYLRVKRALEYLDQNWREQPSLEVVAQEIGLSPTHFQKCFTRWAGISPKEFLQILTLNHAKKMLEGAASVLDATYDSGLSAPSRLHDLFITHEALSPGEYKARGEGLEITYGWHSSPFGLALVLQSPRGLMGLAFADEGEEKIIFEDMVRRWPKAKLVENFLLTQQTAQNIFQNILQKKDAPLRLHFIGSDFEIRVWETLLKIPVGKATTYSAVASAIGKPKAVRAVGTAVGKNPISFVVPCHRVLGKGGTLNGYHWGLTRKKAILGWETAKLGR